MKYEVYIFVDSIPMDVQEIEAHKMDLLETGHTVFYNNLDEVIAIFPDGYCAKKVSVPEVQEGKPLYKDYSEGKKTTEDMRKKQQEKINKVYAEKENKNKPYIEDTKPLSRSNFSDDMADAQDKVNNGEIYKWFEDDTETL
jgi:anthranilate/para-aminobenzoate synthase component I